VPVRLAARARLSCRSSLDPAWRPRERPDVQQCLPLHVSHSPPPSPRRSLFNLRTGESIHSFFGAKKDLLSVAFSTDNRQILAVGRDKAIRMFNTIGELKITVDDAHSDWITAVRYSPSAESPVLVTASYDKTVQVWSATDFSLKARLTGHTAYVSTIAVSPDGSLCASGGRDGVAMLWDLGEAKRLYSLNAGTKIHALCFSPNRYWLCAATDKGVLIWDLESKGVVAELNADEGVERSRKALIPHCTSLAWSADGQTLFAGYSDNKIRVWAVSHA
jgi:guanine nucleotide-binding protein subunit beta-2-like 1 protein